MKHKKYTIAITFLVILGLIGVFFIFTAKEVEAEWFNDNWYYRKAITITNNGSAQTDFQVKALDDFDTAALVTAGKLQSDCDDIRFTNKNGKLLPYWIESGCNSSTTDVWVKIDSIPAGTSVIYMYYGNPSASAGKTTVGTSNFPGFSCKAILDAGDSIGDGIYYIDPTNNGDSSDKFQVYCNMTDDDGGWTLVMKLSKNDFCYGSSKWTDSSPYNEQYMLDATLPNAQEYDAKSKAFYLINANSLRFYSSKGTNVVVNFAGSATPENLITTNDVAFDPYPVYADWRAVFGHDRQEAPVFMRAGTAIVNPYCTRNNFASTPVGCGKLCTFCYQAADGGYACDVDAGANDVNSGIGLNSAYCGGGDANDCSTAGNWSDSGLRTLIWARGLAPSPAGISVGDPGNEVKGPGPVAYWRFDEGYGDTTYDDSPNNNDGTRGGGTESYKPTWKSEEFCKAGKCLSFDGTDDYVKVLDNDSLDLPTAITLGGWVKRDTITDSYGVVISKEYAYDLWVSATNTIGGRIWRAGGGTTSTSTNAISTDWTHIAMTWDKTVDGGKVKLFINSVEVSYATQESWTDNMTVNTSPVYLGNYVYTAERRFKGTIDEVKIYNYSRSAEQIKIDYLAGLGGGAAGAGVVLGAKNQSWLSDGLVGYWKMDEASWTNDCSTLTAIDSSGAGNHGKSCPDTTGPTGGAAGKFGNAGDYDGTSQYVRIGGQSNLGTSNRPYTIAAWVKVDSGETDGNIIHMSSVEGGTGWCLPPLALSSSKFRGYSWKGSAVSVTGTTTVQADTWYHIATTWDTERGLTIYVNGTLEDSTTQTTYSASGASNYLHVAFSPSACSGDKGWFDGKVDETRVYNRSLSPKEVRDLYEWAPGAMGYWKLDEGIGTNTYDSSSNNNNSSSFSGNVTWTQGKFGKAINTDGALSTTGITVNDDANLRFVGLTAETWIYVNLCSHDGNNHNTVLGKENEFLLAFDTTCHPGNYINTGSWTEDTAGGYAVPIGQWVHFAMTYDGSKIRTYANGILKGTGTDKTGIVSNTANALGIGLRPGYGSNQSFNGIIDDVRIYNYARTQKQIIEDMNAGHPAVGSPVGSYVGYWKFDEGYGDKAYDMSIHDNDGDLAGSGTTCPVADPSSCPSWTNSGKFGKALSFDGSDDYVDAGNNSSLDLSNSSYSIEFWMNWNGTQSSGYGTMVCKQGGSDQQAYILVTGGSLKRWSGFTSTETISANTWYHIVYTFTRTDATNGTERFYVDGSAAGERAGTVPSFAAGNWTIGGIAGGTNHIFNGTIDEVKIYPFALTEDEIKMEYNRGAVVLMGAVSTDSSSNPSYSSERSYCPPGDTTASCAPVAEWKFDEKTGTTANDTSGTNNSGTINGSTWQSAGACKSGSCLSLNGTTNDYIIKNPVNSFPTSTITVEFWMKSSDSSKAGTPFSYASTASDNDFLIYDYRNFSIYRGGVNTGATGVSSNDGNWHHITVIWQGSDGATKIYKDGRQVWSGTLASGTSITAGGSMVIGQEQDSVGGGFDATQAFLGNIDNVIVYNYVRTPAQIAWDYNRGKPVAHWRFDECQGTTAYDMSDNNNDGTITIGDTGTQTSAGTCTDEQSTSAWYNGRNGKYNSALSFDGSDDYVEITNFSHPTTIYTVGVWYNTSNVTISNSGIIYQVSGFRWFKQGTNDWQVYFYNPDDGIAYRFRYMTPAADGLWHHDVLVFDKSLNKLYWYRDGYLLAEKNSDYNVSVTPSSTIRLGFGYNTAFDGKIDEVKIYNYVLTLEQILQDYNQGSAIRFGPSSGSP